MEEKDYDRLLRIQTAGTLEGLSRSAHYNRYEATPYKALDELFTEYVLMKTDQVVDYGCGKGRLPFYVHHRFHVTVVGIEMNGHLYQEALENQASYMQKIKKAGGTVRVERGLAEEYEVAPADNCFYFFNPFSIQIFIKVINNILRSIEQHNRSVDLILYYPTAEYIHYLETSTAFDLFKEVKISGLYEQNENERFLIFRLEEVKEG